MKKWALFLGAAAASCVMAFSASAAPEVGYELISEVWIYEPRVTAIAFEFDKPLACAFDLTDYFSIEAELIERTSYEGLAVPDSSWPKAPRTITAAYTSDEAKVGKICAGNYVIVELSDTDSNGASTYISLKRSTQEGGKEAGWNNGREILPYGDDMVYDIRLLYSLKYEDGTFTGTDIDFVRTGESTLIADEFEKGVYVSDTTTVPITVNNEEKAVNSIVYGLYRPANYVEGEKYPLVVYLHGSSCRSVYEDDIDDFMTPILTNQGAITWVKHGTEDCYVFVPQYETASIELVKEAFLALLEDESLSIDMDRIYISGLSMGGMTSWSFLLDERLSDYFAAALINCGAVDFFSPALTEEQVGQVEKCLANGTKIWLVHADTDPTVNVRGSYNTFKAAAGIAQNAEDCTADMPEPDWENKEFTYWSTRDGQVQFTLVHFIVGQRNTNFNMYSVSPHEVYEYTYSHPEYIEWLFAQHK